MGLDRKFRHGLLRILVVLLLVGGIGVFVSACGSGSVKNALSSASTSTSGVTATTSGQATTSTSRGSSTTTTETPTTQTAVTSTTRPIVTTTSIRSTTSSPTTTSSSTTSTTVVNGENASSSSSAPWAWVFVGLAVVVAIAYLLFAHGKRKSNGDAFESWRIRTDGDLSSARLARDLMMQHRADVGQYELVRDRVEDAASACDDAAAAAPSETTRLAASNVATSLRNLLFAQEAEQLLHQSAIPPTAHQLSGADTVWRSRHAELDQALNVLGNETNPQPAQSR